VFDMMVARSFSASDTGGTGLVPFGVTKTGAMRTSMGVSLMTDMRIATTAALGAGTRTLDSQVIAGARGFIPPTAISYVFLPSTAGPLTAAPAVTATAVQGSAPAPLFTADQVSAWPLTLVTNEGFIIRATVPATGTWNFAVELEWAELSATAGYN
jgi:hypothetical protein